MFDWLFKKYPTDNKVYMVAPLGRIIPFAYYSFRNAEKERTKFCDKSGIEKDKVKIIEISLRE